MNFLTVKEVVAYFDGKVSAQLIYRLAQQGKIAHRKIGGKVLILASGLDELVNRPAVAVENPVTPRKTEQRATTKKTRVVLVNGRFRKVDV